MLYKKMCPFLDGVVLWVVPFLSFCVIHIGVRGGEAEGAVAPPPPNFERNYRFRAIPIEIFGQFVGLSINFRSSK